MIDYPLYAKSIVLSFECPNCKHGISHRIAPLPSPNWDGDTVESSQNIENYEFNCPNCNACFEADLYANIYYGELCVHVNGEWENIEDVSIKDEWDDIDSSTLKSRIDMKTPFQTWFEEQVKTQYGDMKGIAYLDGHEGPGEVVKMIKAATEVDVTKYAILGFSISGFEPVGEHIYATVYAVEKNILKSKGSVENLDFDRDIEEISIEDFNWDVLGRYIKRLSIGFAIPEHLQDMSKF